MFIAFFFFIPRPFCDFRLPLLPKSSSGLIPVAKTPSFLQFLNTQRETGGLQLIYRIIVHGKVQFDKDSVEITISFPIHHLPASTKFSFVKYSRTRGSGSAKGGLRNGDGWLTTLNAIPIQGTHRYQIHLHSKELGHPIVGNVEHCIPLSSVKKGLLLCLFELKISYSSDSLEEQNLTPSLDSGKMIHIKIDEPERFEKIRKREEHWVLEELSHPSKSSIYSSGEAVSFIFF